MELIHLLTKNCGVYTIAFDKLEHKYTVIWRMIRVKSTYRNDSLEVQL